MPSSRRRFLKFAAAAAATRARADLAKPQPVPRGPVEPTWLSIRDHYRVPEWFLNAKFGIAVRWGVYSVVPGQDESYARRMYGDLAQYHREHYGPQEKFGYKDFIQRFKFEKYDPDVWAELFRKAGARYVVPVAEGPDGFAMYESKLTRFCAGKMGPKKDLIGELARNVRRQGLVFGVSSRRMEHHSFMYPGANVKTDFSDPRFAEFYGPPVRGDGEDGNASAAFQEDWLARCQELIDKYQPQIFGFGSGVNDPNYEDVRLRCAAFYYNRAAAWSKPATISAEDRAFPDASVLNIANAEHGPKDILAKAWQMEAAAGPSILDRLADAVSKGGNLLFAVAPKTDGTIPPEQQQSLAEVGRWLDTNGEAIYESRPWKQFGSGDFRYTTRAGLVYAIGLKWPQGDAILPPLASLAGRPASVNLLGGGKLEFSQSSDALTVRMPAEPRSPAPFVLRISGL